MIQFLLFVALVLTVVIVAGVHQLTDGRPAYWVGACGIAFLWVLVSFIVLEVKA